MITKNNVRQLEIIIHKSQIRNPALLLPATNYPFAQGPEILLQHAYAPLREADCTIAYPAAPAPGLSLGFHRYRAYYAGYCLPLRTIAR